MSHRVSAHLFRIKTSVPTNFFLQGLHDHHPPAAPEVKVNGAEAVLVHLVVLLVP